MKTDVIESIESDSAVTVAKINMAKSWKRFTLASWIQRNVCHAPTHRYSCYRTLMSSA